MSLLRTKNVDHMIRAGHSDTGLKKVFGSLGLTLFGVGATIGAGIFVLTGTGALTAGPALTLSFIVATLACGSAVLCYAEFASTIPVSGSTHTYAYATMGGLVTWTVGWDLMPECDLATSVVPVGWSDCFQSPFSGFDPHPPAALMVASGAIPGVQTLFNLSASVIMLLIMTLLSFGIRELTHANNIMVATRMTVVLLFIVVGVRHVQSTNWQPFMSLGMEGMFGAAAIVFSVFIGFDMVTSAAEEVRDLERDLPIGITGSLAVYTVLYVVVAAIMAGIAPFAKFAGVDHPVSLALQAVGENWATGFVDLDAIIGMTTVILVMAYGQTRTILAMSCDGLLPKCLSYIHPRYLTPFLNTWVVETVFAPIAAFVPLSVLVELINTGTLAAFSLIAVAVLALRRTRPGLHRGFRCPGAPVMPLLATGLCLFLVSQLQVITWITLVVWALIGLVMYFGYACHRSLLYGLEPRPVPVSETMH